MSGHAPMGAMLVTARSLTTTPLKSGDRRLRYRNMRRRSGTDQVRRLLAAESRNAGLAQRCCSASRSIWDIVLVRQRLHCSLSAVRVYRTSCCRLKRRLTVRQYILNEDGWGLRHRACRRDNAMAFFRALPSAPAVET